MSKKRNKVTPLNEHEKIYIHIRKDVFSIITAPIWMPVLYVTYVFVLTLEFAMRMFVTFFWFWFAWMDEKNYHYKRVYKFMEWIKAFQLFEWLE